MNLLALGLMAALTPPADDAPPSFRDDVAPILVARCLGCHDEEDAQGGLNMSTFAKLREGGEIEGDLILLRGEPDESHLVRVIRPDAAIQMPYKQDPLSDEEIATIERWVAEGAAFDGPSEDARIAGLVDPLAGLPEVAVTAAVADPVAAVAFARDGSKIAAARGADVLILDPESGATVATFEGDAGPINALAFSEDGREVIAAGGRASMFGAVVVRNVETGEKRLDLRGHRDAILAADPSPDGKTLATASYDRDVILWDLETGEQARTLREHTDAVYAVAFSADGASLATGSGDRTVKVWDVASGRRRVSLGDALAEVYAVAFGPDGSSVLAGGVDRTIRRWALDGDDGRLVNSAIAHDAAVLRLLVGPGGRTLYSTGEDAAVKVWSLPGLDPLHALPAQPDWPLAAALSPAGDRIALGRYDGSLVVRPTATEGESITLLEAPKPESAVEETPEPPKPELTRRPTLGPPSPRGAVRGATLTVHLTGNGVGRANAVVFDDPSLSARILPSEKPEPNRLRVELTIAADARLGVHRFRVQTPLGVPDPQSFAVFAAPEAAEAEPNDAEAMPVTVPATFAGAINTPGDLDFFTFEAKAGRSLVLVDRGGALGSALEPAYEVTDANGRVLDGGRSTLAVTPEADGPLTLRVADWQLGGSGNHFYRIEIGESPYLQDAFPRGVERGEETTVAVEGRNLAGDAATIRSGAMPGTVLPVPVAGPDGRPAEGAPRLVVAEGPQAAEPLADDDRASPIPLPIPGGASGRINAPGDIDTFAIDAEAGVPVVVEVFARRIGSDVDPVVEVVDPDGNPVPRAVLRPVAELNVAFRDHNATQEKIRLTKWEEIQQDDYLLIGRELTRLFALPRNPDDDAVFWSMGGRRLAYLGTTPEQHPQDQPIRKVEIHPPGTTFPPGGAEPVVLDYRNDDAPGLGKDAALTFDPPATGRYLVRVGDARGLGDVRAAYHLVVRRPRPDFAVSLSTENPDIPRGGGAVVTAGVRRIDGYDGPIDVRIEGLPPGIAATTGRVEPDHYSADLLLTAADDAPAYSPPTWRVIAEATDLGIRHEIDPGGASAGWITVTPPGDLRVTADRNRLTIRPGERVDLTFRVERSAAFKGRVPIDVRNLPHGVRVLNIGLNGVLVTESETARTVALYAEPWVEPTERPFFAVGRVEAAGLDYPASPITLVVDPAGADPSP